MSLQWCRELLPRCTPWDDHNPIAAVTSIPWSRHHLQLYHWLCLNSCGTSALASSHCVIDETGTRRSRAYSAMFSHTKIAHGIEAISECHKVIPTPWYRCGNSKAFWDGDSILQWLKVIVHDLANTCDWSMLHHHWRSSRNHCMYWYVGSEANDKVLPTTSQCESESRSQM